MLCRCAARSTSALHGIDYRETIQHFSKHNMVIVEPGCGLEGDKELRTVGVWPRVCHRKQVGLGEVQVEVLVVKFVPVDALPTGAVPFGDVATLRHELRNDPVEWASKVVELLSMTTLTGTTVGKLHKVLDRFGDHVAKEAKSDSPSRLIIDFDIEVDLVGDIC